ncbi:U2 small nuclear ribonucleoprotein auxiliary factor 35 kDa subunit-related protein 2 isoform X2 [Drosophila innubila]|uniref:U2 small nuclear ribonucleoprotein auxiliary factor 35 kDa subunit-related protein 2 isoform X2 n=1 Tax=Drosophila innubila TaxID=198719 RepID=UPI00148C880D|nr:U2 small nuclear ribonucleoprotein auxiliary factor 35 kDa subunit-related protein 2 isoform X2 [Drosophila innubila]XP_034472149.1 U2 small nuclear ribonucleoprotein auxiliary factor 35 kDa subunit-related protein 2 isoform X2 [Drosophila innubila]
MLTPGKRVWRKLLKKQQRKRRRQKYARERDKEEALEQGIKETDPEYQAWVKQQEELEEFQRLAAERVQQDGEEEWLRREALAQRQFQLDRAKLRQQEAEVERLRAQQAKELEALQQEQRLRREHKERLAEEAAAEFEAMMQRMHEYMEDTGNRTPPSELRRVVDTHPEERLCEFFTRTNCCRYGHACTFNHKRPMLAKIILIRHFFTHPLLQGKDTSTEYANGDEHLQLTDRDLRADYDEFFKDVVGELEKFGKIINFRAVRNTLPHLRGHVFVEYAQERFALKAFINLQGRYYASKRLNVEFSNLNGWRGAICGT